MGIEFDYENEQEWEGYDGWYNNLAHPDWGGAGKRPFPSFFFLFDIQLVIAACGCL